MDQETLEEGAELAAAFIRDSMQRSDQGTAAYWSEVSDLAVKMGIFCQGQSRAKALAALSTVLGWIVGEAAVSKETKQRLAVSIGAMAAQAVQDSVPSLPAAPRSILLPASTAKH